MDLIKVKNLIQTKVVFWIRTSFWKTLFYNYKYGYLKDKQFIIYKKSKLKIDKSAKIDLGNAHLIINSSHFFNHFRSQYAHFILEKNSCFSLAEDNFSICEGASIIVRENANLKIEGKGFINKNTTIDCYREITIGHGTIISTGCEISDSDTHTILTNGKTKPKTKPIVIGKHVWIGKNSIILKGVRIGDNSIIAAGSVVTKNIPKGCVYGGNPASLISNNTTWKA